MAEFPNGGGVLLFGGQVDGNTQDEDKILEFSAGANSWKILDIKLQERNPDGCNVFFLKGQLFKINQVKGHDVRRNFYCITSI